MPNTELMTAADFASKVEWEGGIIDALDYGLKPADAPEGPLRDAWARAYELWQQFEPIAAELNQLFDAAMVETPEDDES